MQGTPFQPCILLRITQCNDYVMHPQSYSRSLRNRKTYANANANANPLNVPLLLRKITNLPDMITGRGCLSEPVSTGRDPAG